jgi:hypothetical protein
VTPAKPGSATLAVVLVLVGSAGAAGVAGWLSWRAREQRKRNEHIARETMKPLLAIAQHRFRTEDLDKNGVKDYWTGDLAGLYAFGLIDYSLAAADARPLSPLAPSPVPRDGYLYVALEKPGDNRTLFSVGYCAYPSEPGVTGSRIYIVRNLAFRYSRPADRPPPRSWPNDAEIQAEWRIE